MKLTRRAWLFVVAAFVAGAVVAGALVSLTVRGTRAPFYAAATEPSVGVTTPPAQRAPQQQAVQQPARQAPAQAVPRLLTLSQAQSIAERAVGGRAVKAKLDQDRTGTTYELKVVRGDGAAFDVEVDAVTGRLLSNTFDD